MEKDLTKYKIFGKFSILQFMAMIGSSALIAVLLMQFV